MTTPVAEPAPKDIVDTITKVSAQGGLTLMDRCDRCAAQAFVRTSILSSEGHPVDLLWCGHHFVANEAKLRSLAVDVLDDRAKINEKPSVSSND